MQPMDESFEVYLRYRADSLPGEEELAAIRRATGAAILLVTDTGEKAGPASVGRLSAFMTLARRQTVAVLLEEDFHLAKALDADGVHLQANSARLAEARRLLGENKSVGVSCGLSRHEAMTMAEEGADYVAFGESDGHGPANPDAAAGMIRWWSEVFETPCVAWVRNEDDEADIHVLAGAGADYLCVDGRMAGLAGALVSADLDGPFRREGGA
jgi:thiamine-phosphate pyrophosphorylase